jgi:hypothetical protein
LIDRTRAPYNWTAERVFRDRPDVYRAVVRLLAEPREHVSYRAISRSCHCTHRTIIAIEVEEFGPVTTLKKELRTKMGMLAHAATERGLELIGEAKNIKDCAVTAGIATERYLLLSGDPTARIELGNGENAFRKFQAVHDALLQRIQDKPPQIGLTAGNNLANGASAPVLEATATVITSQNSSLEAAKDGTDQSADNPPSEL